MFRRISIEQLVATAVLSLGSESYICVRFDDKSSYYNGYSCIASNHIKINSVGERVTFNEVVIDGQRVVRDDPREITNQIPQHIKQQLDSAIDCVLNQDNHLISEHDQQRFMT